MSDVGTTQGDHAAEPSLVLPAAAERFFVVWVVCAVALLGGIFALATRPLMASLTIVIMGIALLGIPLLFLGKGLRLELTESGLAQRGPRRQGFFVPWRDVTGV